MKRYTVLEALLLTMCTLIIVNGAFGFCRESYSEWMDKPSIETICSNVELDFQSGTLQTVPDNQHIMCPMDHFCYKILTIKYSNVSKISSSVFDHYLHINVLNMQGQYINTILPGAFNSLDSLRELNMSNNSLTSITNGVFDSLKSLRTLDLSYNKFEHIVDIAFTGLPLLENVYLSSNHLKSFTNDNGNNVFDNYYDVKNIDLSCNKLPSFNFTQMSRYVVNLKLVANEISELVGCPLVLNTLDLSNNQLKTLNNLYCRHGSENLRNLDLSYNRFSSFNFSQMSTIIIENLNLTGNEISELVGSSTGLSILNLSNNRLTTSFNLSQFSINAKNLNLAANEISEIIGCYNGLYSLDLSGNQLTSLRNFYCSYGPTNLQNLSLSYNRFSSFNFSLISKVVENLNLTGNKISQLYGCSTGLRTLDLSKNRLTTFKDFYCSDGSTNLQKLDLSYNHITQLDNDEFGSLDNLQYLYLQNNTISGIPLKTFSNMFRLVSLNLSTNQLEEFQYGLLDHMPNLETLDISGNKLDSLRKYNYHPLKNLHSLYIQNNKISYLNSEQLKEHCPNLTLISLDGNKFSCDDLIEIFHNLKYVLHGNSFNSSNVHGIVCNESEFETEVNSITTKNFSRLSNDDFAKSAMYNYFNKDFENSNFFKYLENLRNTGDLDNSRMYNYLNKNIKNGSFFQDVEQLKERKTSADELDKSVFDTFKEGKFELLGILVTIMLFIIAIAVILALNVYLKYMKCNVFRSRKINTEQVELIAT